MVFTTMVDNTFDLTVWTIKKCMVLESGLFLEVKKQKPSYY